MGHYYTAQVCINGHSICTSCEQSPECMSNHCSVCGAETITACQTCHAKIRGYFHEDGIVNCTEPSVPAHCHECGKPYPWTQAAIESLKTLILEDVKASSEVKAAVVESIPDIIAETPKTQLAASRMRRFLGSCGDFTRSFVTEAVASLACEMLKKALWP